MREPGRAVDAADDSGAIEALEAVEAVDADIDLHVPAQRRELREHPVAVLGTISAGGVLGTLARYGIGHAFPTAPGQLPWATVGINITGCLLIGVLMALINHVLPGQQLVRPFLGVGVLGGYTTFSTYVVDIQQLVTAHAAGTAMAYLALTLTGALLGVWLGSWLITAIPAVARPRPRRR